MILLADATGSIESSATSELASGLLPRAFTNKKMAPPTAAIVKTVETSCNTFKRLVSTLYGAREPVYTLGRQQARQRNFQYVIYNT